MVAARGEIDFYQLRTKSVVKGQVILSQIGWSAETSTHSL